MNPRLIIALDFDNEKDALSLVDKLEPTQCALKVGSELFTLLGSHFVKLLITRQFKIFLDLKFHDIPNTVAKACQVCADLGVWMLNVHASGGVKMMEAARNALDTYGSDRPLLIAVTVLTSATEEDLRSLGGYKNIIEQVSSLASLAHRSGLDGVVSSAHEVGTIKQNCGPGFVTVTPGIRLPTNSQDDQSRIMTPQDAVKAGSDYLVIGRPITRAADPALVLASILTSFK